MEQYETQYKQEELIKILKRLEIKASNSQIKKTVGYVTGNPGKANLFVVGTKSENIFTLAHPVNRNRKWSCTVEDNLITVDLKLTIGGFINNMLPTLIIIIIINYIIHFNLHNFRAVLVLNGVLIVFKFLGKFANKKVKKTLDVFVSDNLIKR
jgi:hypothetical protein